MSVAYYFFFKFWNVFVKESNNLRIDQTRCYIDRNIVSPTRTVLSQTFGILCKIFSPCSCQIYRREYLSSLALLAALLSLVCVFGGAIAYKTSLRFLFLCNRGAKRRLFLCGQISSKEQSSRDLWMLITTPGSDLKRVFLPPHSAGLRDDNLSLQNTSCIYIFSLSWFLCFLKPWYSSCHYSTASLQTGNGSFKLIRTCKTGYSQENFEMRLWMGWQL